MSLLIPSHVFGSICSWWGCLSGNQSGLPLTGHKKAIPQGRSTSRAWLRSRECLWRLIDRYNASAWRYNYACKTNVFHLYLETLHLHILVLNLSISCQLLGSDIHALSDHIWWEKLCGFLDGATYVVKVSQLRIHGYLHVLFRKSFSAKFPFTLWSIIHRDPVLTRFWVDYSSPCTLSMLPHKITSCYWKQHKIMSFLVTSNFQQAYGGSSFCLCTSACKPARFLRFLSCCLYRRYAVVIKATDWLSLRNPPGMRFLAPWIT